MSRPRRARAGAATGPPPATSAARPASAINGPGPSCACPRGRAAAAGNSRHAWRGSRWRRSVPSAWKRPSAMTPLPSRNRSGVMPVKRTGIVAAVSSPTRKSIVTPSAMAAQRAAPHHAADPHRAVERQALRRDVAGRVEEARLGPHRRHGEQHGAADRDQGEHEQGEALVLGLHRGRLPSRSASASARRIAAQLHRVRTSVASNGDRIGADHERPGVHGAAIRLRRASTLVLASSARIRISTIAPNSSEKPRAAASNGHSIGAAMVEVPRTKLMLSP